MPETNPATSPAAAPASAALAKSAPAVDLPPLRAGLTWAELRTLPVWLGLHFGLCWLLCYWGYTNNDNYYGLLVLVQPVIWGGILFFRRPFYDIKLLPALIVYSVASFIVLAIIMVILPNFPDQYSNAISNTIGTYAFSAIGVMLPSITAWIIIMGVRKFSSLRIDAASLYCICASVPSIILFCLLGLLISGCAT